ncbi:hypothetical protein OG800_49725 (plasmid) [Streptomyces sp. NBC_00445]|uniref:hypothetical protein n=1 Tax=Streptomyces sp. NBC_00445 TaxID=2975745 RepID=UPI002E2222DF
MGTPSAAHTDLSRIRADGHAVGDAPLPGHTMIAAPLWYGSTIAGAVALLPSSPQMRRATTRARYLAAVMDTAAAMSGQLTRSGTRRAG